MPGSRISSGFGARRHLILGYNQDAHRRRLRRPYGTPLKAAGDGVISVAGWQGAYGKVVRIRHKSNYETVYAHMSRIPTTIKPGWPVRQGQVIGFVGLDQAGRPAHMPISDPPRQQADEPAEDGAIGGRQLTGKNLAAFRQHMQKVVAM